MHPYSEDPGYAYEPSLRFGADEAASRCWPTFSVQLDDAAEQGV